MNLFNRDMLAVNQDHDTPFLLNLLPINPACLNIETGADPEFPAALPFESSWSQFRIMDPEHGKNVEGLKDQAGTEMLVVPDPLVVRFQSPPHLCANSGF